MLLKLNTHSSHTLHETLKLIVLMIIFKPEFYLDRDSLIRGQGVQLRSSPLWVLKSVVNFEGQHCGVFYYIRSTLYIYYYSEQVHEI